jgi:ribonucleoside-diphosphate reductase alpha chain
LDNTACNLASLNLMKFKREDGVFDVERFKAAVRIFITAQEILVDNASYPTEALSENSHIFRTLGLGYANLGSLIMSYGLPYDSDAGRALAGAITAIMTGHAYEQSAEIAGVMGAFKGYRDARCAHVQKPVAPRNVESMLGVIKLHRDAVEEIQPSEDFHYLKEEARHCWEALSSEARRTVIATRK